MAKELKVKSFAISTVEDEANLEEFLSQVKSVDHIVSYDGKVLIIYEE